MPQLSMHADLPFDEATTPTYVSTGDLPRVEQGRELVTEAYERYRHDDSGSVADYIPVLAQGKVLVGSIKMELSGYEGLVHPVARE